ncbi:MAG: tetratricopeptide repeat protein [Chitinophagales bacterium]|nr:tetratricopeptide repeat protein [Chitinophagales bacterium]
MNKYFYKSSIHTYFILLVLLAPLVAFAKSEYVQDQVRDINDSYLYNPDRGIAKSTELLDYGIQNQDQEAIAYAYCQLGIGYFLTEKIRISSEYFKKSLANPYTSSDVSLKGRNIKGLGINYDFMGNPELSLKSYQEALKLFESVNDSTEIAWTWNVMGLLDSKLLQFDKAEVLLNKSLDYFERVQLGKERNIVFQNLATLYALQKKYDKAFAYLEKSKQMMIRQGNKIGEIQNLINTSGVYLQMNRTDSAIIYLENALLEARKIKVDNLIADILLKIAILKNNNPSVRDQYFADAISTFEKNGNYKRIEEAYFMQMDNYAKTGDAENYIKTLEKFKQVQLKVSNQEHVEVYENLRTLYELDKKENTIALQKAKIKNRNSWLIFLAIGIIILSSSSYIFYRMYRQIREYAKSLYQINQELKAKGVLVLPKDKEENHEEIENITNNLHNSIHTTEEIEGNESIENINTNNVKIKEIYDAIISLLDNDKIFTQHDLSISDLSRKLNTNDKYISQAINTYKESNFATLINAYRISEAQNLIEQYGNSIPIKELASLAGYGNLNTFYKKFKESTGLTPSVYIEMAVSEKKQLVS